MGVSDIDGRKSYKASVGVTGINGRNDNETGRLWASQKINGREKEGDGEASA